MQRKFRAKQSRQNMGRKGVGEEGHWGSGSITKQGSAPCPSTLLVSPHSLLSHHMVCFSFLNRSGPFLPQSLCTCCPFCLEHPFPHFCMTGSISFRPQIRCPLFRYLLFLGYSATDQSSHQRRSKKGGCLVSRSLLPPGNCGGSA